jgi:transglutaminase-like putative cysteine protease
MHIRAGYDIAFDLPQVTPMILTLTVEATRIKDVVTGHHLHTTPNIRTHHYRDMFGNTCTRILAPQGRVEFKTDFIIYDEGLPDEVCPGAAQHAIEALPDDVLVYLLGSRYCDTQALSDFAWQTFGSTPLGWGRVQAICDFVHNHIRFDYGLARADRTAFGAFQERVGVCRDFTQLAVSLCRCLNIPARYCTGYLGDIGVPPDPNPMDFSAWFEVFLDGRWFTFDARHNHPRIGRIMIARGRDAADVAISTCFGPSTLVKFEVTTVEVTGSAVEPLMTLAI